MGTFIYFSDEQKHRANSVDLPEFLRRRGEKLIRSGREYRLGSDHSITVRGDEWYDHAAEQGGGPVAFMQKFYGLSYPEAMVALLGGEQGKAYAQANRQAEEPAKPFALPPAHTDMRRVYAYLLQRRGIDRSMVSAFAKAKLLYEDAEYHNCVFVGTDENGVPRHAHKRSVNSAGKAFRANVEGSRPQYSFHHTGANDRLYVFEAPIDMLSFLSLYPEGWRENSYVALCGTGGQAMRWMLEQNPQLHNVCLCLDNDEAGVKAAERHRVELEGAGYHADILLPSLKDWNDELLSALETPATEMKMEMG